MSDRQIAAGRRDHLITIQQLTESKGPSGYPVETWTTLIQVMASKEDATGMERFAANQLSSPFDTAWRVPYLASTDPEVLNVPKKRRVLFKNRVYDIVSATMIGLHREVAIQTLAGGLLT